MAPPGSFTLTLDVDNFDEKFSVPREWPTTVTFVAPYLDIAVLTAESTCVAELNA